MKCRFKMFLREYIFGIIVTTAVMGFILMKIMQCLRNRRIYSLARSIYNEVKTNLVENPNGLSESDILRKYLAYPRKNDPLVRDETTFRHSVWPILEGLRRKDTQRIFSSESLQYGRTVKIWNLK